MAANIVFHVGDEDVTFATLIRYDRSYARMVWTPLSAVHRQLAPKVLWAAVRRIARRRPGSPRQARLPRPRHRFHRGPVTHGSHNVRAPGSIGASADPARVFKGRKMPGRMGGKRATQRGLEVFRVDAERNLLILRGAVPGPRNGTVEVRTDG